VIIRTSAHARAGLLGNPSDIYGGKVISFLIKNFSAQVQLWESPGLTFRLHPDHDRTEFADLTDFVSTVKRHGYYGMQRLLFATLTRFVSYCESRGIPLSKRNFTLQYGTTIPRQSGLGGSSAMIIAALRALLRFYRVPPGELTPGDLAELALSVEKGELGIAAGLQDRVVQSIGGLVYMDLSGKRPRYDRLDSALLPRFGIAYLTQQTGMEESGRVHATVRSRWEMGDREVIRVMGEIAALADHGRDALKRRDYERLGELMRRNFDLRRGLFGDKALGEHTIALVEIARELGFASKLPGSSGAALVLLNGKDAETELARAYEARGYGFTVIQAQ
jgi:glucuronokinase